LSKKSQKARELGIRVINYTEFMRLIESVNNR
jgi:BRCT domain type II-containing protein